MYILKSFHLFLPEENMDQEWKKANRASMVPLESE